jgi:hypothetical protein
MRKEVFEMLMNFLDRLFTMSVNKREKETDYNEKIFKMIRENDLPDPFRELTIERQLALVTGKDINIRFAMKIQEMKERLGGNVTDKQLYRIIGFLKENEEGKLFVNLNRIQILFIRCYFYLIIGTIVYGGILFFLVLPPQIHGLYSFTLYLLGLFSYFGCCFLFMNLITNEMLAVRIKKKDDRLHQ